MHSSSGKILRDIYILCICIVLTIILVKSGSVDFILQKVGHLPIIGSFVAGIFFTSIFTVTASAIVLVEISQHSEPIMIAFIGACGALIGDLLLFAFIKEKITRNVDSLIKKASIGHPVAIFRLEFLRWLNPLLGAIVIASPLPDELGLALLGYSELKPQTLAAILFFMNGLGIFLVATVAQGVA